MVMFLYNSASNYILLAGCQSANLINIILKHENLALLKIFSVSTFSDPMSNIVEKFEIYEVIV